MYWLLIILLILVGLLLIILEIFILPGLIAGIIGAALAIGGIILAYYYYGGVAALLTLALTFAAFILILIFFFRSKAIKKIALSDAIDSKVNIIDELEVKVGDTGKTISRLNPIGKAMINKKFYEVKTNGEFIEENKEIVVFKISENKIYVKLKT